MAIDFKSVPPLRDIIAETEAPVTVVEDGDAVIISTPGESSSAFRCHRFWLAFVGMIYSAPLFAGFSIKSCTIRRREFGPRLPFTRWERFKKMFVDIPERYEFDRIQEYEIQNASFRDINRGAFRRGAISLIITNKEHERLETLGLPSSAVGAPFGGSYRLLIRPEHIVRMVVPTSYLDTLYLMCRVAAVNE